MRAILSVRPKCSHRCVSLKESPLKPVLIPKRASRVSTEQTSMRKKWFEYIANSTLLKHLSYPGRKLGFRKRGRRSDVTSIFFFCFLSSVVCCFFLVSFRFLHFFRFFFPFSSVSFRSFQIKKWGDTVRETPFCDPPEKTTHNAFEICPLALTHTRAHTGVNFTAGVCWGGLQAKPGPKSAIHPHKPSAQKLQAFQCHENCPKNGSLRKTQFLRSSSIFPQSSSILKSAR